MEEELRKKQEQDEAQVEYGSEERGPVLPSGRTGGRRGETARQEDLVKGTHIPIVLHRTLLLRGEVVQIPVHGWRLALADPVRNGTVPSGLLRRAIGTATAAWATAA